ncbi:PCI domain-containing protein 2 [Exaiptasia diaphana]|nr:PCI domain-containing protein 2 [Exaiptasia diaphana]
MAHFTLNHYFQQVDEALSSKDGETSAIANAQAQTERWFEQPYDELIACHLRAVWSVSNNDYVEAYASQAVVVQYPLNAMIMNCAFNRAFQTQKDENWSLPLMNAVVLDLRQFASKADKQLTQNGRGNPGETLEKAAEAIMGCFRVCASDSRSSLEVSKKWGMLALAIQLFKIYFKINKLHLCKPLIRAIESAPIKEQFKIGHLVAYRAVLIYLIPVKMLLGLMPSLEVLQKYKLMQFIDIVTSVRTGNLLLFNQTLEKQQAFFIECGIYLILEKLKILTYRNLFKKVSILLKTHQLPLDAYVTALKCMQVEDIDIIEIQCIVANLIYMGYIKGYISHQHQKLVVSKQNAFPALSTFL